MAVLTITKDRGGVTKATPALYAEPEREMTEDALAAFMPDSGMNGPFLADLMSAMLAHEQCGTHLYRSCEGRTNNPMLQRKYRQLGEETARHVEILMGLIEGAGGHSGYVSPMARAVHGMDTKLVESTFMLSGSLDPMTAEMAMLDAVFLAESMDHANWKLLAQLTEQLPEGDLRDQLRAAADEVEEQEDEHLQWAATTKERLVMMQASGSMLAKAGEKTEEIIARIRSWLSDDAD